MIIMNILTVVYFYWMERKTHFATNATDMQISISGRPYESSIRLELEKIVDDPFRERMDGDERYNYEHCNPIKIVATSQKTILAEKISLYNSRYLVMIEAVICIL